MPSIKAVKYTTQAKKDLKRYRHKLNMMRKLQEILYKLCIGEQIPEDNKPHRLTGNYNGFMECHVGNDFLLIWLELDYIEVVRIGSHSELFG